MPLVSADLMLISNETYYDAAPRQHDYDPTPDCQRERSEESCKTIAGCDWVLGQCFHKVIEGCGFVHNDPDACTIMTNCVWMSDVRDATKGVCTDTNHMESEGKCSIPGFLVNSKSTCNLMKGCSWKKDDGEEYFCGEARTQLECDSFDSRETCKQAGCVFRIKKGNEMCTGRWEYAFLKSLKKMDGDEAKQAIEAEYGTGTYNVVLVKPDEKTGRREPRMRNRRRIRLFLNKKDKVRKTPKFG